MIARPASIAFVLALLGAGCAHAPATRGVNDAPAKRTIPLGFGIALPAGESILKLPADRLYRFVSPDSLVRGATSEDAASVRRMSDLRTALAVVLQSQGWRESMDSAEYDIAVFIAERTLMRTEVREELIVSSAASGLPRCDASRMGNQPRCTNETARTRQVRVAVPYSESRLYHIIRRRSDGGVLFWAHASFDPEVVKASVARDLLRILLTPED